MAIKAVVDRDGAKNTIEGKNLIDIVEQVMMHGGKGVTMVEIIRDGDDALDRPSESTDDKQ
jgi:hypothetical protein